ncbi:hypothetical protein EDC04DRAFT_2808389 [Pisolithus marmoratus]|nr:hypothetical protein EDC04DRAFT_2808389 [Pisolithus marmoratus]
MASFSPLEVLTDIVSTGLFFSFMQFVDIVRSGDAAQLSQGHVEYLHRDRRVAVLRSPPVRHQSLQLGGEVTDVATPCSVGQELPSSETMSSLPSSCGTWIDGLSVIGVDDKLQINRPQTTISTSMNQATKPDQVPIDCLLPLEKKVSFSPNVTCFTYKKSDDANDEETCESTQDRCNFITELMNGRWMSATKVESATHPLLEKASKDTEGEDVFPSVVSGTKRCHLWNRFRIMRRHQRSDGLLSTRKASVKRKTSGEEVRRLRQSGSQTRRASAVDGLSPEDDAAKSCLLPVFHCERNNRQWDGPLVPKGPPRATRRKILAAKARHLMTRFF